MMVNEDMGLSVGNFATTNLVKNKIVEVMGCSQKLLVSLEVLALKSY